MIGTFLLLSALVNIEHGDRRHRRRHCILHRRRGGAAAAVALPREDPRQLGRVGVLLQGCDHESSQVNVIAINGHFVRFERFDLYCSASRSKNGALSPT